MLLVLLAVHDQSLWHYVLQEEGLRAVARKRCLRLARQAVVQWKETVCRARERQARERRTLQALADVHIGISPSPFKVQWPVDEPQDKVALFLTAHLFITLQSKTAGRKNC